MALTVAQRGESAVSVIDIPAVKEAISVDRNYEGPSSSNSGITVVVPDGFLQVWQLRVTIYPSLASPDAGTPCRCRAHRDVIDHAQIDCVDRRSECLTLVLSFFHWLN